VSLPLFDDVVVDAVPPRDGPVRIHEDLVPTTAHTSARLSTAPAPPQPFFELDDPRPRSYRPATLAVVGSPEYAAYWSAFHKGKEGQSAPGAEHDEGINRYLRDGYRLGKLVGWTAPKERR
jgi:hypothetical protein